MLAGVLIRFVLAVFESAGHAPALVWPLVGVFLVARLLNPSWAVLAVLAAGGALAAALGLTGPMPAHLGLTTVTLIAPRFEPAVLIGLGLPLFLVTMASQNLPGFAVLQASGYQPPARSILSVTGLASVLTAFLGAHTSNLAAITAAICTGPDTHPDPQKRWMAGPFYGLAYLVFAAFGASLVAIFAALPGDLVKTVAGLALVGPLMGALAGALADEKRRFAAVLTLVVTASGYSAFSIGSAFWGLAAGLLALGLDKAAQAWRGR
jgi:benzoate membrane transport protein